ncbi:MAG: carotenoid oxygenase family protein [Candidatus Sericytochromatia bacterium]|nr:carotenoid oxygenase family protein [Candidatus Sericytochromatia bacterium]
MSTPGSASRALAFNRAVEASPGALDLTIPAGAIEGRVPPALHGGRLLSNGPGWTRIGGRLAHPFDGHGYVRAFDFLPDGSCRLRARFVETRVYRDEAAAGRLLHRGLATNRGARFWENLGLASPRNVANTSIVPWGGRWLTGWEGGLPHALDPETLATRGEDDLGGALAGQAILAHMRHDVGQERLVTCALQMGRDTGLTFREHDATGRVRATHAATLPGLRFTHDFAMTRGHFVVGDNPLRLRPSGLGRLLLGLGTMLEAVVPDDRAPGLLHLVARDGSGRTRAVRLPDRAHVLHFANAFEGDGAVVVDACIFHRFTLGEEFGYTGPDTPLDPALPDARGPQRLYRITIPTGATEATWELLTPHGVDFPRVHPDHEGLDTPRLFGATRQDPRYSDPFDAVIGLDLRDRERPAQLFATGDAHAFVGEPIFVPASDDPARGHVLVMVSDGRREASTLVVLDAADLARGPLAAVPLPLLPLAFHGAWEASAQGAADQVNRPPVPGM